MLWYKAWRESRARFLLLVLFTLGFCLYWIIVWRANVRENSAKGHPTLVTMAYGAVFPVQRLAVAYLVVIVPLLSMGGLLRERGRGTAGLSLSIPLSRARHMSTRAAVGAVEMAVLAALPAVLIPMFLPLVKEAHPVPVALHFVLLWVVCGAPIFALGLLSSTVLTGEYTPLIASVMAALSYVYFNPAILSAIQPEVQSISYHDGDECRRPSV